MGANQTYRVSHSKKTINKIKRQSMDWQKMFANGATEKSLVSKIYEQLILLNNKNNKNKQPNWKMGRRSK